MLAVCDEISFPVHICGFDGYIPVNNPNFTKLPGSTLKMNYPDGITIKFLNSSYHNAGYQKVCDIYCTKRIFNSHLNRSYIGPKYIMRVRKVLSEESLPLAYSGNQINNSGYEWGFYSIGQISDTDFNKTLKVYSFCKEYLENFRV